MLKSMTFRSLLAAVACAISLSAYAIADTPPKDVNVPAGELTGALEMLAKQMGTEFIYSAEQLKSVRTHGVHGKYTAEQAVTKLLEGTKLKVKVHESGALLISDNAAGSGVPEQHGTQNQVAAAAALSAGVTGASEPAKKSFWDRFRTAEADQGGGGSSASVEKRSEKEVGLEEVIVTAQRREERLQDVPMSITVLTGKDIEQQQLVGMNDYLRSTPGVSFIDQGVGRNTTIIRGISTSPQDGSSGLVGTYFGEVPLLSTTYGVPDIKLVDMDRVEVLRGPQGTVYGAGSLSGAVRNIPAAPKLNAFEGLAEVGYSATSGEGGTNNDQRAMINVPLIKEKLAFRAVGYRFDDDGYVNNVAGSDPLLSSQAAAYGVPNLAINQSHVGGTNYTGGRIEMAWAPTDSLTATLMYLGQDLKQDGFPDVSLQQPGKYQQAHYQIGEVLGGGSESLTERSRISNLVVEYRFPWASLLSSSSYSTDAFRRMADISSFFAYNPPSSQSGPVDAHDFSQELRLVSHLAGPVQFLTGLFYEKTKTTSASLTYYIGAPSLNPYGADQLLADYSDVYDVRQTAAYGELSYTFLKNFTVTGGARKFKYQVDDSSRVSGPFFGGTSESHLKSDEGNESYKLGLNYKPAEGSLIYAQWSQGFRLGGPQPPAPANCDIDGDGFIDGLNGVPRLGPNVKSDFLDNYELGGKFDLLDRRISIDASVYEIKWIGVPITVVPPCGYAVAVNAGHALSRGAELQSAFYIAGGLRLNVGGSYVRAELDGDAPGIGNDGDRLPGSPKLQYNFGFEYSSKVAATPVFVRADYTHVGGFYNNVQQTGVEAGDYSQVNMTVGATLGHFDVSLFANNLTNADSVSWVNYNYYAYDARIYRLRPRTVGISAAFRF